VELLTSVIWQSVTSHLTHNEPYWRWNFPGNQVDSYW